MADELHGFPIDSQERTALHRAQLLDSTIKRRVIWVFARVVEVPMNEIADVEAVVFEVANRVPEEHMEERLDFVGHCDDFGGIQKGFHRKELPGPLCET